MLSWTRLAVCCALTACIEDYSPDLEDAKRYRDAGRDSAAAQRDASTRDAAMIVRDAEPSPSEEDASMVEPVEDAGEPSPCSLAGRWLITERVMTTGLGARQVSHTWYRLELTQRGEVVTVTSTLACGTAVTGLPPLAVTGDMSKAFASFITNVKMDGRTGSARPSAGGCDVELDTYNVVLGASVPHYQDPDIAMPTSGEAATGDTPGWEDWDEDGHPGITVRMTGAVFGSIYMATRTRSRYFGSIDEGASQFDLAIDGDQENVTLGLDGSPLLDVKGVRDGDATQHYVGFARLADDQAAGEGEDACAEVRDLAPTLTANAMK